MSFPFTYTGELVFYKPDDFNTDDFVQRLKQKLRTDKFNDSLIFSINSPVSKLPIKVQLEIIDDNTSLCFKYHISLFENNVVLIAALVFSTFFYYNSSVGIAITALLLGVIYYLSNTSKISHSIKSELYNLMGSKIDFGMVELWSKQKKWMKDSTLCPACGEPKNNYSNSCVNCGLVFSKNKPRLSQTNTSLSNNSEISYQITKRKK